jgi:hypothetical protein
VPAGKCEALSSNPRATKQQQECQKDSEKRVGSYTCALQISPKQYVNTLRQVLVTATVYFKRFYARYSLKSIEPILMVPTCVFLTCKVRGIWISLKYRIDFSCYFCI